MKSLNRIFAFFALCVILTTTACKKDKYLDTPHIPLAQSTFSGQSSSAYYVQNLPGDNFKVPVSITAYQNKPVTLNYSITSPTGAASGVQYNILNAGSITIPAGKILDSITVNGLFNGFPGSRRDTLILKLTGGDLQPSSFNNTYTLVLSKLCPVVLPALAGAYGNTNEYTSGGAFNYGPYSCTVSNVMATSATTATCQISNLYDDGWPLINATLDWTNPAAFRVTIAGQANGKTFGGLPQFVRTSTATGAISTFSSCDNNIRVAIDLYTTASVQTNNYIIFLRR